ncbi:MAG: alkaline phosphatase family protein [Parvularculaceae bacterium]|nr:alkaline phosphatase family protein [Parvularculaceae bacterium]
MKLLRLAALASLSFLALAACETSPGPTLSSTGEVLPRVEAREPASDALLTTIAFGSCLKQKDPMPILASLLESDPDLTILLGDNVYGDVSDIENPAVPELVEAYATLAGRPEFQAVIDQSPVMATWDDHDYGKNDLGKDLPVKEETEEVFEAFWNLRPGDERLSKPGIYTAKSFGPDGQRVQIILLDTRFFRDDLTRVQNNTMPGWGRYSPSTDPDIQMLGEEQETWLASVLDEPADLRILVSSIQIIAEGHGWEAWQTMPAARQRLYDIIRKSGVNNLVAVSGDRHLGGLYSDQTALPFPLYELTTSSLNAPQSIGRARRGQTSHEAGPKRMGLPVYDENFGTIEIDWQARTLKLAVRGMDGEYERTVSVPMDLKPTVYKQGNPRVADF